MDGLSGDIQTKTTLHDTLALTSLTQVQKQTKKEKEKHTKVAPIPTHPKFSTVRHIFLQEAA